MEAFAYFAQWMLYEASRPQVSLKSFETTKFKDCNEARIRWKMAWDNINSITDRTYEAAGAGARIVGASSPPMTVARIQAASGRLGLKFSCSQLRPVYEKHLQQQGVTDTFADLYNYLAREEADQTWYGLIADWPCPCRLVCPKLSTPFQ